ncbi:MAG: hypothetical protein N3A65_03625 [candidate division WOR-3 bacterium]|nr:hypothetical protein [candidate division WOR-3 bacterium]
MIMLWLLFLQIEIKANLSKEFINKKLTVGDPFEIVAEISIPADKNISDPFIDSLEPFAIIEQRHKIIQEKGFARHHYHFRAAAFSTGDLKFPSIKFILKDGTGMDTIQTNPVDIKILSILPEGMKDINDIKEMLEFPDPLPVIILVVIVVAGALIFFGLRFYRKMKQKKLIEEKKIPSWERALNALDMLLKEDLLNKGLIKRFYYTLTEIIKRYLEERFNFPAIEQTTTEIIQSMKLFKVPMRDEFQNVFQFADMVKYAKFVPTPEATEEIIKKSRELILKTIPEESEQRK